MRIAFFHEDDYCQSEILPLLAEGFCQKEMGNIEVFANEHRKGAGYTDMYLRNDSPHSIEELALHSEQLNEVLSFIPAYDRVESGYSSYREELKSTYGRGNGSDQNVFWSVNEAGLVNAMWLDLYITPENNELWKQILNALGKIGPVLLADWSCGQCVNLTSPSEIEQYINDELKQYLQFNDDDN